MTSFVKDPDAVETFTVVWCSKDNTNDGTANDTGELQGATISTIAEVVPSSITLDSSNKNSTTIQGVTYAVDTVHNLVLSGGTAGSDYDIVSRITTSDGRTLDKTITIMVRET
jgi:hypothetical protein